MHDTEPMVIIAARLMRLHRGTLHDTGGTYAIDKAHTCRYAMIHRCGSDDSEATRHSEARHPLVIYATASDHLAVGDRVETADPARRSLSATQSRRWFIHPLLEERAPIRCKKREDVPYGVVSIEASDTSTPRCRVDGSRRSTVPSIDPRPGRAPPVSG